MGDPKKIRKKYKTPRHPWEKDRIDKEKELTKIYGLKNKKEIWKFVSKLKKFTRQAKSLLGKKTKKTEKEGQELLNRLRKYDLILGDKVEDVLNLNAEDILGRRLQTKVYKMGLARTPRQARQFITHGHIAVSGKKTTVPSYLVKKDDKITFVERSSLTNPDHPERISEEKSRKVIKEAPMEPIKPEGIKNG